MFNSFSFLKALNVEEKKKFSEKKYQFYSEEQLRCFYIPPKEKLLYYSLSFSARYGKNDFNIDEYISYWNRFIKKYYPDYTHREKSIKEQIAQHVDIEELPKHIFDEMIHFFKVYKELENKTTAVNEIDHADVARQIIAHDIESYIDNFCK